MAYDKDKLRKLKESFSESMAVGIKPIPVADFEEPGDKKVFDEGEIWYYRDSTGQEQDKILAKAQDGGIFAAYVEAILWRCVDENCKQLFAEVQRADLKKLDPKLIYRIANVMKPLDDTAPDTDALVKNSSSTQKQTTD